MSNFTKLQMYILHMKFSEFHLCNHNSCEIWHSFSWISKFSLVLLQMIYYILVQGFCPLKIKITQFPGGFFLDMIFLHFIFRPLPEASQCLVRDNENIITTCTILLIKNKTIILFIAVIKRLGPGISLGYYKHAPPTPPASFKRK